jgi:hypothetical protein
MIVAKVALKAKQDAETFGTGQAPQGLKARHILIRVRPDSSHVLIQSPVLLQARNPFQHLAKYIHQGLKPSNAAGAF